MNIKSEALKHKVELWIKYADDDLRMAQHGLTLASNVPYSIIAYHAQQCAEKYLKAYLVFHAVDFPYTHNIGLLIDSCATIAEWPQKINGAVTLTDFAITARYPSDVSITKAEAIEAIDLAGAVKSTVREALFAEGLVSADFD